MRHVVSTALVAAIGLFCHGVYAWQEGVDHGEPVMCSGLALAGADRVVVRVKPTDGSCGPPVLVGMKEDAIVWRHPFPNAEEVNAAKLSASCKGKKIILWFQHPGSSPGINQDYRWDGN